MGKSYIVRVAPFSEELACPRDLVAHGHGQVRDRYLEEIMKGKGIDLATTVYSYLAALVTAILLPSYQCHGVFIILNP